MQNPLRSEAAAFRLLLAAVAYVLPIAVASALGGPWAALAVFAVLTLALAAAWLVRRRRGR